MCALIVAPKLSLIMRCRSSRCQPGLLVEPGASGGSGVSRPAPVARFAIERDMSRSRHNINEPVKCPVAYCPLQRKTTVAA